MNVSIEWRIKLQKLFQLNLIKRKKLIMNGSLGGADFFEQILDAGVDFQPADRYGDIPARPVM